MKYEVLLRKGKISDLKISWKEIKNISIAFLFYFTLSFWMSFKILSTIWGCNVNITLAATSRVSALPLSVLASSSAQEDRQPPTRVGRSDQSSACSLQHRASVWSEIERDLMDHYSSKYPNYSTVYKVKPNSCLYENLSWVLLCSGIINTLPPGLFLSKIHFKKSECVYAFAGGWMGNA